jgi:hypothetical protein
MKAHPTDFPGSLPGRVSAQWPEGEPLAHGTFSLEVCAPRGRDPQLPHAQDEPDLVQAGEAGDAPR